MFSFYIVLQFVFKASHMGMIDLMAIGLGIIKIHQRAGQQIDFCRLLPTAP